MKILVFTSLYPNAAQPNHGIFVENRLRHLVASGEVEARVVAPVPWFPARAAMFERYAAFAKAPPSEQRHGIEVSHPRYPVIPRIGMSVAPWLMYRALLPRLRGILRSGFDFDLIDAHYFYPDGVAAVLLGRALGKPVVVTARGSDINLIARHRLPRTMMRRAAGRAAGLVAVSNALKREMANVGIDPTRITVLRNGVDLARFRPTGSARRSGSKQPVLLSAGNLVPLKGHDIVIRALAEMPDASLVIAGQGPEESRLRALVDRLGLQDRVRFLGAVPHEAMPEAYSGADVLVLASAREGWPNVLLEAMACGTPVVATNVSGIPEVVGDSATGRLIERREPAAVASAVRDLLADPPTRSATRAYAERFAWDATTHGQLALFRRVLRQGPA